ncbi:MAG: Ig-like domain-containing protein, partial [Clostridiales bacterium]|nr:Ig-like domain-containing protein [Clostridiales bacterium]
MKKRMVDTISAVNDGRKKHALLFTICAAAAVALVLAVGIWLAIPKIPSLLADEDTASNLYVGETLSLLKEDVTESQLARVEEQVVWTSSNEAVATVDSDGTITTLSAGTATVTAQVKDNSYTYLVSVSKVPTIVAETDEDEDELLNDSGIEDETEEPEETEEPA